MNDKEQFVYDGDCLVFLQYNGNVLDTAAGLDDWLLNPRINYPYFCYFNQGQSASLVDGVSLTGQTSGAVIKVGHVITTGGTLGGSDGVGILFFSKTSGEIQSGENLRVVATTYCVAGSIAKAAPLGKPKAVSLDVETNNIRYALGGFTPTSSTGTPASYGILLVATLSKYIAGTQNVASLQMIHAAGASNAVVNVGIYY